MNEIENQKATASHRRRNRRRNYLINPAFQWKHAGMIMLCVFVVSSLLSTMLYGVLHHQARLRSMHPETYQAEVSLVILFSALLLAAVAAAGVGTWWIILSHRICGPLSVMGGWLAELGRGSYPHLRPLRRKDEFKDFYAILSETINSLKARREAELSRFRAVLAETRSVADGDERQLRDALESVNAQLESWCQDTSRSLGMPAEAVPAEDDQQPVVAAVI